MRPVPLRGGEVRPLRGRSRQGDAEALAKFLVSFPRLLAGDAGALAKIQIDFGEHLLNKFIEGQICLSLFLSKGDDTMSLLLGGRGGGEGRFSGILPRNEEFLKTVRGEG